ncbi:MAG: deoxyribose-phosphate aldolase [Gammaproteobacteria bacterium]|nr:deoxyribose-phosphate aldolase [Gammaproteobacteria bacterium]
MKIVKSSVQEDESQPIYKGDSTVGEVCNPGIDFNIKYIDDIRVNLSAIQRRTATMIARRALKKDWQAAWLIKAISCIDLTTLSGQDTPGKVRRLCAKAQTPISRELQKELGIESLGITTGAVCVYHEMVETAVKALKGTNIPVAAVSTGFPAGLSSFSTRIQEVKNSVAAGAKEIDIVITRGNVLNGNWKALYDEVSAFKKACGDVHMKTIISTGELSTLNNVARASMVSMMAGSDFIKTSTGMESKNATLAFALVMARMIRQYHSLTGYRVGFKPAGGISSAKDAINYLVLMKEELGNSWLNPEMFRFGASSLLADIERQLEHHATGRYSAFNRHPIS